MDAKHTLGPWNVCGSTFNGALIGWEVTGPKAGSVDPIAQSNKDTRRSVEEEAANARLIAAASELLDACLALIKTDNLQAAIDKARAAIAKATGTAP